MGTKLTLDRHEADARGPELALAGAGAATAAAMILAAVQLPGLAVLPVGSLVLLVAGFAAAALWWGSEARESRRLSYRDVAGILVFFGFAAALLSDPAGIAFVAGGR
jgi:hypothetical protein